MSEPIEFEEPVVGVTFRPGYPDNLQGIKVPDRIELVREPDNEHDENAIGVWWTSPGLPLELAEHLGYIGRDRAAQLAPILDDHAHFGIEAHVCELHEFDGETKGLSLWITIRELSGAQP